jgi:protein O-mannosyl-transferase
MTRRPILICLTLLLLTVVVYVPTRRFGFIEYDDPDYVSANPHVQAGLTAEGFRWAFTSTFAANWFPVTWLTLMCQANLWGVHAEGYHLANVAVHGANAVLLFAILSAMTGWQIRSGLVAALFAVHPMHVESVAWVAEWKDMLSTFFLLLAIGSYVRFVQTDRSRWYAALLVCYALSLLSKPMGVTLAPLLLLLDYWPLRRTVWRRAVLEKLPLIVMAAASSLATYIAQSGSHAVASDELRITARAANAVLAYVVYIRKLAIPTDLAAFYPYSVNFSPGAVAAAVAFLCVVSGAAVILAGRRPYFAVGWFWFLGTLVPTIGIVQVGAQSMADRYSYVPSIGLFIIVVWWVGNFLGKSRVGRQLAAVLAVVVICLYTALACQQVQYWRDTESLFVHTAAVAPDNWIADLELGNVAHERGDLVTAAGNYSELIRLRPRDARGYNNLANCIVETNPQKAIGYYEKAIEVDPSSRVYRENLAIAYDRIGDRARALQERNTAEKMHTE